MGEQANVSRDYMPPPVRPPEDRPPKATSRGRFLLLLFEFKDDVEREEIWRYGTAIGQATLERHDGVKAVSIEGPGEGP